MSNFFKAELKDKFLQYAADREDYFQVQLLYDEFLRPHYSLEYVIRLIREIMDYDHDLLDIMSGNGSKIFMLSATALTADFLEEGGFTQLFIQEEEKWDVFIDQLSNNRKLSATEKQDLALKQKKKFRKEKAYLFSLLAAVAISFVFTVYSMLGTLVGKKKYLTEADVNKKIEQVNSQNKQLLLEIKELKNVIKTRDTI
ncbi:hypothetical protein [Croceivirga radicis]|uniref:Uncharacterized protein n=1 Tax=Croceivirga radicis TaxID=1929488 RepID=A0A1V6LPF7_9FLAO|nr:hypothetical protein [Croceivirga radicis]OQD42090.1 hypothetical protein BUL40_11735 [Croceivirga radicis]